MPRVEENSIASSLHYALTDSQCSICGAQLEWKAEFNDINSPKYTANHCNHDYIITIDSVKVEVVKQSIEYGEEKSKRQEQQQQCPAQQPSQHPPPPPTSNPATPKSNALRHTR